MSEENTPAAPARVVEATLFRGPDSLGPVEIIGSTKHGTTTLLAFETDEIVRQGDKLKTKAYLLNAREFSIVGLHSKPMKIAGVWYEVKTIATPAKPTRR